MTERWLIIQGNDRVGCIQIPNYPYSEEMYREILRANKHIIAIDEGDTYHYGEKMIEE